VRYLKKFENLVQGENWKISLHSPEFYISLKKLGMNDKDFERWSHLYKNGVFYKVQRNSPKLEYIIVEKYLHGDGYGGFTWTPIDSWVFTDGDFNVPRFKYMGEIIVTPEEIEKWNDNIEMINNTKKYNL